MDRLRQRLAREEGFTLIELLVVIAVLAILAAIVIFNVTGVTNRGNSSACVTDEKSVQTASDAYKNDKSSYAVLADGVTLDSSKLVPTYLHTWPSEKTWVIDGNGTVTNAC